VSDTQRTALQAEYAQITAEIDQIGSTTNYNGTAVFTNNAQSIFLSDGASNSTINTTTGQLSSAGLGLQAMTAPQTVPAVQATATVSMTSSASNAGGPANGDTLTVGGTTYKFMSGAFDAAASIAAGTVEVKIGANPSATVANLVAAVNGGAGAGTGYVYSTNGAGSAANTDASAVATGSNVTFTALAAHVGAAGNAIALSQGVGNTSGNLLVPSAFTGGVNQSTPTVQTYNDLSHAADAQATLGLINSAIATVAGMRGTIGADINRLQAASNVMTVQVQNLTSAEDGIMAADIPTAVSNLSRFTILNQSGISALAQANSAQQSVLKLLQ
jgi:flagellin